MNTLLQFGDFKFVDSVARVAFAFQIIGCLKRLSEIGVILVAGVIAAGALVLTGQLHDEKQQQSESGISCSAQPGVGK